MAAGIKPRLLFDVTGLVAWYAFYRAPTGVQRVIERISMAPAIAGNDRIVHVARFPGVRDLFVIDRDTIQGLGEGSTNATSILHLRRAYADMMKHARLLPSLRELEWFTWRYLITTRLGVRLLPEAESWAAPDPSYAPPRPLPHAKSRDVFVNFGDFWWYGGQSRALGRLKAQHGFALVQMIHDLFPLGHSAWEPAAFKKKFIRQFQGHVPLVDRWIVNSEFVRGQLLSHLKQGASVQPIDRIPMGWPKMPLVGGVKADFDRRVLDRFGLQQGRYFLQVGTLEPRKNHISVARAVERLRRKHGASLATCVFVGIDGWRSKTLMRYLKDTQFAGGAIRWLKKVDDSELAALYRGALFSVYPSLSEGWGLPVQESLAFGVPCIASHTGAIPEAGLDLAVYVDPTDNDDVTRAIERYLTDPLALAAARSRIGAFVEEKEHLPSWNDAACMVLDAAEQSLGDRRE
jgi:glycosyltransferase involved in cell wall biosynthesis